MRAPSSACARSSTSKSSARTAPTRLRQFEEKRAYVAPALSERVRVGVSPHAPYTCSREVYAAAMGLGLPVATHLNESQDELDWLLRGEGPWQPLAEMLVEPEGTSGIRSLAAAGLLDERVAVAHCVKVDEEEIGLLAGHGVAVTHCPRSNALLGCGIAPLAELRAAGIRIGIGTDGVSSVPSHDFFEELRTVISFARARSERADALSATAALELATLGGARALGLDGGDRLARPGQEGRPDPGLAFRLSVSTMGGPGCSGGLRRITGASRSYPGRRPNQI